MTAAPVLPDRVPPADPATQLRRCLRLAGTLVGIHLRARLAPAGGRDRLQLCSAARILTALGVVVRVVPPRATWPRAPHVRLVAADDAGWLGDLAVLTAVPRNVPGWGDVSARAFPGWPGRRPASAAPAPDAVAWSVAVRYRTDAGPLEHPPATLTELLAARGLVVEVHLLQGVAAPTIPAPRRAA